MCISLYKYIYIYLYVHFVRCFAIAIAVAIGVVIAIAIAIAVAIAIAIAVAFAIAIAIVFALRIFPNSVVSSESEIRNKWSAETNGGWFVPNIWVTFCSCANVHCVQICVLYIYVWYHA